jgi:isoleucyl-tRNA synthetase
MNSVHLEDFPSDIYSVNKNLVDMMDVVREVCSSVLSIRKKFNLRARLPLAKLTIIGENALKLEGFKKYILDEANVKKIILDPNFARETETKLEIYFDKVGKKFGKKVPEIVKLAKQNHWKKLANGSILIGQEILSAEDFKLTLIPTSEGENFESIGDDFVVVLDVEITEELEMEGISRDFVRFIQSERKQNAFEINDKIKLFYSGDIKFKNMIQQNIAYIKEQCLIEYCEEKLEDKTFVPVNLEGMIGMISITNN